MQDIGHDLVRKTRASSHAPRTRNTALQEWYLPSHTTSKDHPRERKATEKHSRSRQKNHKFAHVTKKQILTHAEETVYSCSSPFGAKPPTFIIELSVLNNISILVTTSSHIFQLFFAVITTFIADNDNPDSNLPSPSSRTRSTPHSSRSCFASGSPCCT